MDLLFDRTSQIDPALSFKPAWYRNAYACTGGRVLGQDNFFEAADVIRDLDHILAEIISRNNQLPIHHWLRVGNKAGVTEASPMGSVDIYHENEPCSVTSDWHGVYVWGPRGKMLDITSMNSFDCRLRKKTVAALRAEESPQREDGTDGSIYIEKATFFDFMRPYLFDLFRPCDWALQRRLLVFPMWT